MGIVFPDFAGKLAECNPDVFMCHLIGLSAFANSRNPAA
jgi:hypothetical protein